MSPYRENPFERSRRVWDEAAKKKAAELNQKEKRSRIKGLFTRKKQPLKAVDVLQMEQMEEESRRSKQEPKEILELYDQEKITLQTFFEKKMVVPKVREDWTVEKLVQWAGMGLKPHYLPPEDMKNHLQLQYWLKKPDYKKYVEKSKLSSDIMVLKGGWVLVDTIPKPNYDNGNQMYKNDILSPVIEELRKKGIIQNYKYPKSRFNLSSEELEKPEVIAAFAKAYGVKPNQITIQKEIEFNVIGNIHHPEWDETDCSEWFGDPYDAGRHRLCGGSSDGGGLSDVRADTLGGRYGGVGFRVLVRFSL